MTNLIIKQVAAFSLKPFLLFFTLIYGINLQAADVIVSTNSTWSALGINAVDNVTVANDITLTIDVVNAQCASLQIGLNGGSSAGSGTIVFNL